MQTVDAQGVQTGGSTVEELVVTLPVPDFVASVSLTTNVGSAVFHRKAKRVVWKIGKLAGVPTPKLEGTMAAEDCLQSSHHQLSGEDGVGAAVETADGGVGAQQGVVGGGGEGGIGGGGGAIAGGSSGVPAVSPDIKFLVNVEYRQKGVNLSGLRIDSLDISGVDYSPYKGCRYTVVSGNVDVYL
eukprot:GHVU01061913.1.p2 GENE.GHVU01061913.1~~GHVU01061913.1.p2  ORF type:complete len:185 (-),score=43.00 GHVU01061913.1:338-892(-)